MNHKTVLITGASRGIGKAIAATFAGAGYDLVLNCTHSIDILTTHAKELEELYGIRTLCVQADVGNYAAVADMFAQTKSFCKGIDILINNAGISHIGLLSDMSIEKWNNIINTNLSSVFSCCKHAIPYMVSQKSGKIINISSDWGLVGASCEVAYSASKGGINAFTKALAKELAPSNIQVNAVACGVIDTSMNSCFDADEKATLADEIPAGRFGSPTEVAKYILQLSNAPSYLTGQIISFDGGWI
ncbi:MAG: SDR family NAD(P)-dependent oxidoreductase [Lachnospiraceae bacterium]|nr:SDR family NAD(P)-dependent oxidoreductase [Lachnospiraceae bacterium]